MKVGTDGVLLGAWVQKPNETLSRHSRDNIEPTSSRSRTDFERLLDIGTGSGLIALMLAQRFPNTQIDAIDIHPDAVEQAKENFQSSAFSHQLSAFHSSLQEWQGGPYDLIVSNPPYFTNSLKNPDKSRQTARHTDTLSYEELLAHSTRLLNANGQLTLILPAEAETEVREIAARHGLFPTRITRVYSKESKPARRVLMSFIRDTGIPEYRNVEIDSLVLENETGGRSAAYSQLCKEFYL